PLLRLPRLLRLGKKLRLSRSMRKLRLGKLRRLLQVHRPVKHIEGFIATAGAYPCGVVASSRRWGSDLFSRQGLLAVTNSAFGIGERRSGARMGGRCDLYRCSPG